MNFEELSAIWNSQDNELEQSLLVNRELIRRLGLAKVKSRLHNMKWTAILGVLVVFWWLTFLGGFIVQHLPELEFSIPAFMLLALSVYSLAFEVYRFLMLYNIDSRSSVAEAQRSLILLKKMETWDINSLLVIIPLFSGPFFLVLAKGIANISLYDFDLTWQVSYMAGSMLVAILMVFILEKFPDKSLAESISFLEELKEDK